MDDVAFKILLANYQKEQTLSAASQIEVAKLTISRVMRENVSKM